MLREIDSNRFFVTVISHDRTQNVKNISYLVGPATWIVGNGEVQAYRAAGNDVTVEGGGLCESRNLALKLALENDAICVQVSDDLKKLEFAFEKNEKKEKVTISFDQALQYIARNMFLESAYLGGIAPTANLFYFSAARKFSTKSFVVGDLMLIRPCALRFNESLRLKEDYDYTLKHIMTYGRVLRANGILATFVHRTNKGGAVGYRTSELEKASIRLLKETWGDKIRDNPRRKDEILLKI